FAGWRNGYLRYESELHPQRSWCPLWWRCAWIWLQFFWRLLQTLLTHGIRDRTELNRSAANPEQRASSCAGHPSDWSADFRSSDGDADQAGSRCDGTGSARDQPPEY